LEVSADKKMARVKDFLRMKCNFITCPEDEFGQEEGSTNLIITIFLRRTHSQIKTKTALVLLLLLFFSQMGYYFIYAFQQYELREQMRYALGSTMPEHTLAVFGADRFYAGTTKNSTFKPGSIL
jgi:hypothetical protein